MYDIDKGIEYITLKEILKRTTEYDIYQYYINGNIKIGKIMSSPFRSDVHPSFGIFKSSKSGDLLWKDQATGDTGNVIKFVEKVQNLSYSDALRKVWDDVVIGAIKCSDMGKYIKETYQNVRTTISVARKNFTKTDDDYWGQYFIDRELLKKHLVFPIQTFWVNGVISNIAYTKEKPLYAYEVYDKFQIYSPYGSRKDKFRTNCSPFDLYGYEQLPWIGNILIITKSKKDVMVLDKLGYNAVAPTGENTPIPDKLIEELKKRFNKIYILYDNDEAGINGAIKLNEKIGCTYIHIPFEQYKKFGIKDISDYIKAYHVTKAKELLITMINMDDIRLDETMQSLETVNKKVKTNAVDLIIEDGLFEEEADCEE